MRIIDYGNSRVIPMNATHQAKPPTTVKRTVSRGRLPNAHYRQREYLTEREVERLMKAAGGNAMATGTRPWSCLPTGMASERPN